MPTLRAGQSAPVGSPPAHLPEFALADQFGREHHRAGHASAPVIVVAGNREGAAGVARWTASLRAEIGDRDVNVLPVADLRGVPRVVRRLVRGMLPRDPAHWCALDWEGHLGALVRGEHGPLAAAAYGADGALRSWRVLPLDTVTADELMLLVASVGSC